MKKATFAAFILSNVLAGMPVVAGIAGATADGTWDCQAMDGGAIGELVVADTTYAMIRPDGTLGSYGTLHQIQIEETELPHFLVMDGFLKDKVGATGIALKGPREHEHDLSGELFLELAISETDLPYCKRRAAPAT